MVRADEPCNSVYAYLVAASDAMSGARTGARRELAEHRAASDLARGHQSPLCPLRGRGSLKFSSRVINARREIPSRRAASV